MFSYIFLFEKKMFCKKIITVDFTRKIYFEIIPELQIEYINTVMYTVYNYLTTFINLIN